MKNKTTAALLALFLGGLGIHKFYLGKSRQGLLYLLFCWTFIPSIIGLVDAIGLFVMDPQAFNYKYNSLFMQTVGQSVRPEIQQVSLATETLAGDVSMGDLECAYERSALDRFKGKVSQVLAVKKNRKIAVICGVLTILFIIGKLAPMPEKGSTASSFSAPRNDVPDEGEAYIIAKHFVEQNLKAPATADFPWSADQSIKKPDGRYIVRGHVDSENSFGANIRSQFLVEMRFKGGEWNDWNNWTLTGIAID